MTCRNFGSSPYEQVAEALAHRQSRTAGWGSRRNRYDRGDAFAGLVVWHCHTWFQLAKLPNGIAVRGIAFAGDRGVSHVEVSTDGGETWQEAMIGYPGTRLTWVLWSYDWKPSAPGEYDLTVRATDGRGELQQLDKDRSPFSGVTGFHQITVYLDA